MGLLGSGWSVAEGAASVWAAAGAAFGGLRDSAEWPAGAFGLHASQRREPSGMGRPVKRSVSAWLVRQEPTVGDHRRLSGLGASFRNRLSAGASSALLG